MSSLPGIKLFDLSDRVAIVTGGSKGLGQAMSAALASAGAHVVVVSRHAEEAESVAHQLTTEYGRDCLGFQADVSDQTRFEAIVAEVIGRFQRLDILINNAGINIRGPIDELTLEQFQEVQRINVEGVWICTRAVVPFMKKAGQGRIINLASTLGVVGLQNRTPYTASKGAVVQMTRALAMELAAHNILCNAICPGPFLTPMNQAIADSEEATRLIVGAVALGRWARLEEIQGAAIFLASDASSYVTGSLLMVDGGWTAH